MEYQIVKTKFGKDSVYVPSEKMLYVSRGRPNEFVCYQKVIIIISFIHPWFHFLFFFEYNTWFEKTLGKHSKNIFFLQNTPIFMTFGQLVHKFYMLFPKHFKNDNFPCKFHDIMGAIEFF